jgi:hypothetical protein
MKEYEIDQDEAIIEILAEIESRVKQITKHLEELTKERQELKNEYDMYTKQYYNDTPNGLRKPILRKLYF